MSETGTSNEGQRKKHLACAAAEERREHLTSKPTFITAKPTEPSQVPHSRQTSWWRQGVRWQLCCLRCIAGKRSKGTKSNRSLLKGPRLSAPARSDRICANAWQVTPKRGGRRRTRKGHRENEKRSVPMHEELMALPRTTCPAGQSSYM